MLGSFRRWHSPSPALPDIYLTLSINLSRWKIYVTEAENERLSAAA